MPVVPCSHWPEGQERHCRLCGAIANRVPIDAAGTCAHGICIL